MLKFKYFKAKFTIHWLVPCEIEEIFDNGVVKIRTIDETSILFVVNGHKLKVNNKLINKEDFMKIISTDTDLEIMGQHSNMPSRRIKKNIK